MANQHLIASRGLAAQGRGAECSEYQSSSNLISIPLTELHRDEVHAVSNTRFIQKLPPAWGIVYISLRRLNG